MRFGMTLAQVRQKQTGLDSDGCMPRIRVQTGSWGTRLTCPCLAGMHIPRLMPAMPNAAEPRVLSSWHPQRTGSNNLRNSPLFAGVFLACRPSQPGSGHFVGENLILTETRR